MKTSVICPANRLRRFSGFSLIEITVVLVLLSLLSLVVLPRMGAMYNSFKHRSQIDRIKSTTQNASLFAYTRGQPLSLSDFLFEEEVVPEGWAIHIDAPIRIKANGVCMGGEMEVQTDKQNLKFMVLPPFCRLQLINEADS